MEYSIVVTELTQESQNRMEQCSAYMPYSNRITSCTETAARTLGYITEDTFQVCANQHAAQPQLISAYNINTSLSSVTNAPVMLYTTTLEAAYAQLTPNMATMMCSSRPNGDGHTVIISRNINNEPQLIDASVGVVYEGETAILQYLQSQNLINHSVPVVSTSTPPITITPMGGGFKFIMVNIPKTNDMYAMLGMVADKTFSRLVNISSVPLNLVSIDIESTLKNMVSHKATLIYGKKHKGHTMILLKNSRLELLDPVTNLKYVGYSEIMKYLSTFTKIMTLYTKSRSFKSKKSRSFKSKKSRTKSK